MDRKQKINELFNEFLAKCEGNKVNRFALNQLLAETLQIIDEKDYEAADNVKERSD